MEVRIRITRWRVITGAVLVLLASGVYLLRLALPGPNAVVADRKSIRARLAIPRDLREFPVERYIGRDDWFVYRNVCRSKTLCDWCLHITAGLDDAEAWSRAFREHLDTRGKYIERGGNEWSVYRDHTFFLRQDSGSSGLVRLRSLGGRLHITFAYYRARRPSRFWQSRFGRYVAAILLKVGLPVDAITQPS